MFNTVIRSCCKKTAVNTKLLSFLSFGQRKYSTATATFEIKPFRLHNLQEGPETGVVLSREDALNYYVQLQTIRVMEMAVQNLWREKLTRGYCHLYVGQEAVAVGIKAALRPHDVAISSYRIHGWAYLFGGDPLAVLAEVTGRCSGYSKGKGGSMHMYAQNFYGGHGIVGAQVPLGVGLAFAQKYKGTDGVCVALYGDGAANQGQVFEVFNIAKLWNIPCIFVCENNGYGMSMSTEKLSANQAYYTRGDYIPGIWVDGMDVLAVREITRFAVEHCRAGKGPILIEAATYRYLGHDVSDPGTDYRTIEEIEEMRQNRDAIWTFSQKITSSNLVSAPELKKIEDEIHWTIDEAVQKAKTAAEIDIEELTADIYAQNLEGKIRNVTVNNPLEHKRIGPAINQ